MQNLTWKYKNSLKSKYAKPEHKFQEKNQKDFEGHLRNK